MKIIFHIPNGIISYSKLDYNTRDKTNYLSDTPWFIFSYYFLSYSFSFFLSFSETRIRQNFFFLNICKGLTECNCNYSCIRASLKCYFSVSLFFFFIFWLNTCVWRLIFLLNIFFFLFLFSLIIMHVTKYNYFFFK